jgi:hypothetical protein
MVRLQPTTISITSRDLNDAERRSRYRKHLLNRRRTNRRRDHHTPSKQEATIFEDALNTRVATPILEPIAQTGTHASPSQYATEGEEDTNSPPLLLGDETDSSSDSILDLDANHDSNHSAQESEQHGMSSRPRPGSSQSTSLSERPTQVNKAPLTSS